MILIQFISTILEQTVAIVHTKISMLKTHESKLKVATSSRFACKHMVSFSRWILINQDVSLALESPLTRNLCLFATFRTSKIQSTALNNLEVSGDFTSTLPMYTPLANNSHTHTYTYVRRVHSYYTIAERIPQSFIQMCLRILL